MSIFQFWALACGVEWLVVLELVLVQSTRADLVRILAVFLK